jgi:hypothetical protein
MASMAASVANGCPRWCAFHHVGHGDEERGDLAHISGVGGRRDIPLKFEMFKGSVELTDASQVALTVAKVNCDSQAPADTIEVLSSGATTLRYDTTGGQFIQNWKTPAGAGCYKATMTAADGSSISAFFKMLK